MTGVVPPASTGRHHLGGSRSLGFVVLSVSDTHTEEDDVSGHLARELLTNAGHKVVHYDLVANSIADVKEKLEPYLAEVAVEAVVTVGGTGVSSRDLTVDAVGSLGGRVLPGFGELYRSMSYGEVGPLALISRATLFVVRQRPVFALPGSERAVRTALEKLVLPSVQHLVEELER
ncbi:MAG TPA: molybdopterin-binding protein [Thermoplasmata archaeon]|nr:molybdopterin-binding protein [Thermoplasmata archaeon]